MTIVPFPVVRALVAMATRSQRDLSALIGMNPGNFSRALKGDRAIPAPQLKMLLGALGLNGEGHLSADRVHLWDVGAHVEALRTAAAYLFPCGADFCGVWREGRAPIDLRRIADLPLIAITDDESRVIVRSRGYGLLEEPEPIDTSTIPALRNRLTAPDPNSRMLQVPTERFRAWEAGTVTPREFDDVLAQARVPPRRR